MSPLAQIPAAPRLSSKPTFMMPRETRLRRRSYRTPRAVHNAPGRPSSRRHRLTATLCDELFAGRSPFCACAASDKDITATIIGRLIGAQHRRLGE